jgi:thiol:disulfide interchange protein
MRQIRTFIVLLACFHLGCITPAYANPNATCVTVKTDEELSEFLKSKQQKRASVIYVRADWAISSRMVNDVYVPSIAFLEAVGDNDCVVVDVTKSGGADVMRRFDFSGVPFFAIVDAQGNLIAKKVAAVEFSAFKSWVQSIARQQAVSFSDPVKQ